MSKLDDQLAHSVYCGVWEAHHNDDGELQSGPCSCDLEAARTELAALRRRAEDAEAMLRAALTDVIDYGRASMAKHKAQVIVHLPDDAKGYPRHPIFLDIDLFTGLPILTDEAREALK